ncbi:hypothetical protein JCM5353_006830 [Sporobolomyces roseus]
MLRIPTYNLTRLGARSFSTSRTSLVAPFLYSPLNDQRSLLSIQGKDTTKLLQGLVSNDVKKVQQSTECSEAKEGQVPLIYMGLLQADGRYMSDLFLHSHPSPSDPSQPSYMIDHPSLQSSQIRTYLKRHILRSKLKLGKEVESEWEVVQAWRNTDPSVTKEDVKKGEEWFEEQGKGRDPRVLGMGWRWIAKKAEELPSDLFQRTTQSHYHLHRITHSIPENPPDFPALPLEANLDLMNGIDYKKGCYVGQELTARTHFKGVVRKRGVALRLFREGEDEPTELLAAPSHTLIPSPSLYPTPQPGSILTPLPPSSSTPSRRAPRPAGKLGLSLPLISPSGSTSTIAFASVKIDALDQTFVVSPPSKKEGDGVGELQEGEMEEGRWFAKAWMNEWVEFRLEEEEIAKGV